MQVPEKKTGFAHVLAATSYSLAGLRYMFGETAFRHHLIAGLALLIVYMVLAVPATKIAVAACIMLITLAFEAVNTAIELMVDRVSPEFSEFAKHAKDLGSFSVFCLLCANAVYAAYAILPVFMS